MIVSQKHSRIEGNARAVWLTERLWKLADGLAVRNVAINEIAELDQDCWFGPDDPPTCTAVARHAQKIADADLALPIILSADGRLMDGGHRLCKAWLSGHLEIAAVQFDVDPEPDYVLPLDAEPM